MSEIIITPEIRQEDFDQYGHYSRRSTQCPICLHAQHMQVNLLRARDHRPLDYISRQMRVTVVSLETHFEKHYVLSPTHQKILDVLENTSRESNELIARILDGEVDLFAGSQKILEAKAIRLHPVTQRIKALSDLQDIDALTEEQTEELTALHRTSNDIENSMTKVLELIDKKLFPADKEERAGAVLHFKLSILEKLLDNIQLTLLEFETQPEYQILIQNLRVALSRRFNILEEQILKSGGFSRPVETTAIVMNEEDHGKSDK